MVRTGAGLAAEGVCCSFVEKTNRYRWVGRWVGSYEAIAHIAFLVRVLPEARPYSGLPHSAARHAQWEECCGSSGIQNLAGRVVSVKSVKGCL